jgi:hypothetical protein
LVWGDETEGDCGFVNETIAGDCKVVKEDTLGGSVNSYSTILGFDIGEFCPQGFTTYGGLKYSVYMF